MFGRIVVLLSLPLALTLISGTAHGLATADTARPKAPVVKAAYLPSLDDVIDLYDGFEDGARETASSRTTFVLAGNCRTYEDGPTADKGRFADYYGPFGSIPVHAGLEQPSVFVMSFATEKRAKKAYAAQRAWITHCDGRTVHGQGETDSYDKVGLKSFGRQRIAYRHAFRQQQTGGDPWYMNQLIFWIRDGRFLVNMIARQDVQDDTPASAPLRALTRRTMKRLP